MKLARPPIPPKKRAVRARAWRKGGVGGIPPRPSRSEAFPPSWYQDIKAKQFSNPFKRKRVARKIKELKRKLFCFDVLIPRRRKRFASARAWRNWRPCQFHWRAAYRLETGINSFNTSLISEYCLISASSDSKSTTMCPIDVFTAFCFKEFSPDE